MAWLFGIAAECERDKTTAKAFVAHFQTENQFPEGMETRIFQDAEGNHWGHVYWDKLSDDGIGFNQG